MSKLTEKDVKMLRKLCCNMKDNMEGISSYIEKESAEMPIWAISKIAVSAAYIDSVHDFLMCDVEETEQEEDDSEYSMIPPSYRDNTNAP